MVTLKKNQILKSAEWLKEFEKNRTEKEIFLMKKIFDFYEDNESPLLKKGIEIAVILQLLDLDGATLAACILYPAYQTEMIDESGLNELIGEVNTKLLSNVLQMETLAKLRKISHVKDYQSEKLRKMLLSMVVDVRVILFILALRLWQLRKYKNSVGEMEKQFAQETMDIYAPLANRLGVWQLKWEMEDLCLRCLAPEAYRKIAKGLALRRLERELFIQKTNEGLTHLLKDFKIDAEVSGRVKHIYSIYKKMHRKKVSLKRIYDVIALRVLTNTIKDCYAVLSLLHSHWQLIPEEFDDYIASPKPNGYRSIHTVLVGPKNQIMEVQIRTYEMHKESECGIAAHWQYKEGAVQTSQFENKIALLRQIMDWQKEVTPFTKSNNNIPLVQDLFADRVYVFTPLGDVIDLPKGATPLDFAYHVHSEVGHRCRGAKVSGNIVPLTYELKPGEVVEILTAKLAKPSRDWLNPQLGYLISSRARERVQHWFRAYDEKTIPPGVSEKTSPVPTQAPSPVSSITNSKITKLISKEVEDTDIQVFGECQILKQTARCCAPLPGEKIIGYVTRQKGISIHRNVCSNILYLTKNNPSRLVKVDWIEQKNTPHYVDIVIQTQDRAGLLGDITAILSAEKINIIALQTKQLSLVARVDIYLEIEIKNIKQLRKIFKQLEQVPHVIKVFRQ